MPCPYCAAPTTTEVRRRSTQGYRMIHCHACRRTCNERTGTLYNHLQVPTDSAVLVVLWRLQDKLALAALAVNAPPGTALHAADRPDAASARA